MSGERTCAHLWAAPPATLRRCASASSVELATPFHSLPAASPGKSAIQPLAGASKSAELPKTAASWVQERARLGTMTTAPRPGEPAYNLGQQVYQVRREYISLKGSNGGGKEFTKDTVFPS